MLRVERLILKEMQAVLFFSDVFALCISSSLEALARLSKTGCTCVYGADGGWL